METLRNTIGFFGPSLLADITLIVQILFYLVLCAGVTAQLQGNYKLHDRLQTPVVVLNIFFIIFVMIPTFQQVAGQSAAALVEAPTLVTTTHAILGAVAQLLAIYCLLAGLKILPRKIGTLRYWMWATFTTWTAAIVFGISVYILFYTGASVVAAPPLQESVAGEPNAVSEHAGPLDIEETAAPTVSGETAPNNDAASPETTTELMDEHAEESILPDETDESSAMVVEDATDMDELVEEQIDPNAEIVEPDMSGQEALEGTWLDIEPRNQGPSSRYEHAMQYNLVTNQAFVFGGRNGSQIFNDTWALELDTLTWRQLAVDSPEAPPARYSTVMIVDEAGENLYVATGHTGGGQNFNDVWRLDLTTETWEQLIENAPDQLPEPRYGNPGGAIDGNLVMTHGFGNTRYDDTWQFNPATGDWENLTPTSDLPLRRCLFAAAPLQAAASLVIHGGCAAPFGDCFLDDAWVLDIEAGSWRQIDSDLRPVGRQYQSLAPLDTDSSGQVLLFGGQDKTGSARNDLWLLDVDDDRWQQIETVNPPAARYQHAAVWLPERGMLLFGGRSDGPLDDMWLLTLSLPEPPTPTPTATSTRAPASPTPPPSPTVEPTEPAAATPTVPPAATPTPPPDPSPTPPPSPTAEIVEPEPTDELISEHDGG